MGGEGFICYTKIDNQNMGLERQSWDGGLRTDKESVLPSCPYLLMRASLKTSTTNSTALQRKRGGNVFEANNVKNKISILADTPF